MKELTKRERLLIASLGLASETGYHSLKISDITERAEVAKGTFYTYFKDKADCFRQASANINNNLRNRYIKSGLISSAKDLSLTAEMVFESTWYNRRLGRLYASELLSIDEAFAKDFALQNATLYQDILKIINPNENDESLKIKSLMVMGIIDALIFEVFASDDTDEEVIKRRFIKAFEAIANCSI